jgi:hypothetical protein
MAPAIQHRRKRKSARESRPRVCARWRPCPRPSSRSWSRSKWLAAGLWHDQSVLVVHATRAFRDRVPGPAAADDDISTTSLGPWYATLLRRRPPLALLVNQTLLPLLMPLAPAATLLTRIPAAVTDLLLAHHLPAQLVVAEHAAMAEVHLAPTANRSVVGVLNEFAYLTDAHQPDPNCLLDLSVRLATTPLGPLYQRHITPDRELAALIAAQ